MNNLESLLLQLIEKVDSTLERLDEVSTRVENIGDRLDSLEQQYSQLHLQTDRAWISKSQVAQKFGWSETTLKRYRNLEEWDDGSFPWKEGIHWQKTGASRSSPVEYNLPVLKDWKLNRLDHAAHQRAIENWLSNQQIRRKRA